MENGRVIYDRSSIALMLLRDHYLKNEAMIAAIIGHQIGRDLTAEKLWKLSMIWLILHLGCQCAPCLVNFMRRRLLAPFRLAVIAALLSYFSMIMYSLKMEMEADYIGHMLASARKGIVGRLYPKYGVRNQSSVYLWVHICPVLELLISLVSRIPFPDIIKPYISFLLRLLISFLES